MLQNVYSRSSGGGKFFAILQVKRRNAADDSMTKQVGIIALAVYRELKKLSWSTKTFRRDRRQIGNVVASIPNDGSNPDNMEFARLKAYTARTRGRTTSQLKGLPDNPENAFLKEIPGVVAVGGGVPLKKKQ